MAKQSQIDRAIAAVDAKIAVLEAVRAELVEQRTVKVKRAKANEVEKVTLRVAEQAG
jgi:hypothetical protein